jgi:hypothetical protein
MQDLDGVIPMYWDEHFSNSEIGELLPKGSKFSMGIQKRYPLSKKFSQTNPLAKENSKRYPFTKKNSHGDIKETENKLETETRLVDDKSDDKNKVKKIQKSISIFFEMV